MSTDLTEKPISSTYDQLLHVDGGPTNEEKTVYSGTGVPTALKLSTGSASVDNVRIDGSTITTVASNSDLVLAPDGAGKVQITNAAITNGIFYGNNTFSGSNTFPTPTAAGNPLVRGQSIGLLNGVDLNTVIDTEFYRLAYSLANAPLGADYSQLIVSRGGDTITQIVAAFSTGEVWTRSGNPPEVGGSGSWSPWHALTGIGINQTWYNVTSSRFKDVLYYNTTSKPIVVEISTGGGDADRATLLVNNILVSTQNAQPSMQARLSAIVPVGASYKLSGVSPEYWAELR